MSTRGFIGFVTATGEEKISYNHCDSYPDGLGVDALTWAHKFFGADTWAALPDNYDQALAKLTVLVSQIVLADGAGKPTPEQVDALLRYSDVSVGAGKPDDWYVLLRKTQGDLGAMLDAGYMLDAHDFPYDSLFAEWGYLVDLEAQRFEVYRGFQSEEHHTGRFADRGREPRLASGSTVYHACKLVAWWQLDNLPTEDAFLEQLKRLEY